MNDRKTKTCYVIEAASVGVGRHVGDLIQRLSQRDLAEIYVLWSPARADQRFLDQLERSGVCHQTICMRRSIGRMWEDEPLRDSLKVRGAQVAAHSTSAHTAAAPWRVPVAAREKSGGRSTCGSR